MKTHIVEQDRDGMITPVNTVWLVLQTQAECDYRDFPIAVYTSEEDALEVSRALNKRYGRGYKFTAQWDCDPECYEEYDDTHYYTVMSLKINPDKGVFL